MCLTVAAAVVCVACGGKPVDTLRVESRDGDLTCLVSVGASRRNTAENPLCVDRRDYISGSEQQFADPRTLEIGQCVQLWDAHPTYGLTRTTCPTGP